MTKPHLLASAACLSLFALPGLALPTAAWAADAPSTGEIVVTASKRAERLQEAPLAITAITGQSLEASGAVDIASFASKSPSLSFSRRGPSQNRLSIRGLTSFAGVDAEFPMVGLYVDEVPISDNAAPDFGLYDVDRIEVLRGPQGTLYGEGSMGGTVRYLTKAPKLDAVQFGAGAEWSTTKDGSPSARVNGVVNAPIIEGKLGVRLAGWYEKDGGFVDNFALKQKDADSYDRYGGRLGIRAEPTSRLTLSLTGAYQQFGSGIEPVVFRRKIDGLSPPLLTSFGDTIGYRQLKEKTDDRVWYVSGVVQYDLRFATLTSATSAYDRRLHGINDEANTSRVVEQGFAPLAAFFGADPFFLTNGTAVRFDTGRKTFSQEVRLVSNATSPLKWTLGAYYANRQATNFTDARARDLAPFIGFFNPAYKGELQQADATAKFLQTAVFGEATYSLTKTFDITLGGRWFDQTVKGDQRITVPDFDFSSPTFGVVSDIRLPSLRTTESKTLYKFGAAWRPSEDVNFYANIGQGFRPGGVNARFNPGASAADSPRSFKSDSATSYELGAKTQWLDKRVTANVAFYRTDLKDAQFLDPRDPSFNVVRNAAKAQVQGLELEASAALTDHLDIGLAGSLVDAKFVGSALQLEPGLFLIKDGQRLPVTRKNSISAYADYRRPIGEGLALVAGADIVHVSNALANTTRPDTDTGGLFEILDPYTIANARIGVERDRWSAALFVDNLTDETAELGGLGAFGISRNKPRTIGVRARLDY